MAPIIGFISAFSGELADSRHIDWRKYSQMRYDWQVP